MAVKINMEENYVTATLCTAASGSRIVTLVDECADMNSAADFLGTPCAISRSRTVIAYGRWPARSLS